MQNQIEYKGEELPIKTDFSVISKVCNKYEYKFQEFAKAAEIPDQLLYLFHQSLLRGHQLDNKKFNYADSEIEEILCDNLGDFMELFSKDVLKMYSKKSDLKIAIDVEAEAKKKKKKAN